MKRLRSLLSDRAARRDEAVFVAEGLRLIEGILDRGGDLRALYVEPDPHDPARVVGVVARADEAGIPVFTLEPGVGERISATVTPQRVFAEVSLRAASLGDVLASGAPVLLLVGIQDPGNAGTILRSAEAAGFGAVLFGGAGVDPWNPKAVRASAGAVCGVAMTEVDDPVGALAEVGAAGYLRVASVVESGETPDAVDLSGPLALVIGSEAHGLDSAVVAATDVMITIPMHGAVESLNAGMAATVLAFEVARQRGWKP